MSKLRALIAFLAALCVLLVAARAEATHFRYGNITYTIPDPVGAPTTVRFDVTVAWRATYVDSTILNFGDGKTNPSTEGAEIGSGTDATGLQYKVMRYTVTHTYAAAGLYTAFFTSCCRLSNLINAGDDSFRVEAKVDITGSGNTANPVSAVPAIIQLQAGAIRTHFIPATDPDGVPVTCRFATIGESSISQNPPVVLNTGNAATVGLSQDPPGCLLTWNLTAAPTGDQYAVQVVIESVHNGITSSAVIDYIIEVVLAPPPSCSGSGTFPLDMGDVFMTQVTGVNNTLGPNLLMTSIGSTGIITPVPGTTKPSPYTTTFNWSPGLGEDGTSVVTIIYTDQNNSSGYCSLTFTVASCPGYSLPCKAGVGGCEATGTTYCDGANVMCTAMPGQPQNEVCDGVDNDCNGVVDDNNPQAGVACTTGLPGACSMGVTNCPPNGSLECVPDVPPGSIQETCNTFDDNCDGVVDDGFNVGTLCSEGSGSCQTQGFIVCDGMGGAECSATPGVPQPEVCNGLDDDCDLSVDEGFTVGDPCSVGTGVCAASGSIECDGQGGTKCGAVAGMPAGKEECGDAEDEDCDGLIDNGCAESDGDGIFDDIELATGTDPDDADSDDDGVADGEELSVGEDTDGDGLINGIDADSDDDGLFDGTEMGLDCSGLGTDAEAGHCVPDADGGATKTNPLNPSTDSGGAIDGSEDTNLNGAVDAGEGDPNEAGDDAGAVDTDGDGLSDGMETFLGSSPSDKDSDDDGALDGEEPNPSDDRDGDGLNTLLDVDSDNDALFDGTEMGKGCMDPDTDTSLKRCRKDTDLAKTTTSPLLADTDGGGASDGSEDPTLNGAIGSGEQNPKLASDDALVVDTDGDGMSDALEATLKANAADADSDDDGVIDGKEPNPSDDRDFDGKLDVLDADSDDDLLFDGTEMGLGCTNPATDPEAQSCVPDADGGKVKTSPLLEDTDGGGALDGEEDANQNGALDDGERDPLAPADDALSSGCVADVDCGDAKSGRVCEAGACIDGCRGQDGNGCPDGKVCTSPDASVGACEDAGGPTGGTTGGGETDGEQGGCDCRAAPGQGGGSSEGLGLWLAGAAAALALQRRRARGRQFNRSAPSIG